MQRIEIRVAAQAGDPSGSFLHGTRQPGEGLVALADGSLNHGDLLGEEPFIRTHSLEILHEAQRAVILQCRHSMTALRTTNRENRSSNAARYSLRLSPSDQAQRPRHRHERRTTTHGARQGAASQRRRLKPRAARGRGSC